MGKRSSTLRMRMAPVAAALAMLRRRPVRSGLMLFQFTVGFAVLLIMAMLIYQSQRFTRAVERTFPEPERVLGLAVLARQAALSPLADDLSVRDLPALEALPGVDRAAVLFGPPYLAQSNGGVHVLAVNAAYEEVAGVRVVERFAPDAPERVAGAGPGWVFLTPEAHRLLLERHGSVPDTVRLTVQGRRVEGRVAGIAAPAGGWMQETVTLNEVGIGIPGYVIDLAAVADWAPLDYSIWLLLEEGADPTAVKDALQAWYPQAHPENAAAGAKLELLSVEEEVAMKKTFRQPGVWISGVLGGLILLLAGLGLAGQTMLLTESRRMEWALRLSLGATRGQLTLQVLVETAALLALGAGAGLLVAWALTPAIANSLGYWVDWGWLWSAIGTALAVSLALCALAAAYPIRRISREEASVILKENW